MTGGGLHRRTSSAALHYSSLPGNEGQDITSLSSTGTSRSQSNRGGGSSNHSAVSVKVVTPEEEEDMDEEKAGLLESSPKPHHHPSSTTIQGKKRKRSRCRILFLLMVLCSTAIILYALVTGWVEKRDVEKVWGNWKDWTAKQQENWKGSTSPTTEDEETGRLVNSTDATSIEALLAAKGRPRISSSSSIPLSSTSSALPSRPTTSTSFLKSSNMTFGSFSKSRMNEINDLVDNGNLSVYKWHDTLPSLATSSSSYSTHKNQSRRLIVVGDLHGTHRSLFHLLRRISYTPSHDTLLHTGDILSKSTLENSLATITLLRKLGAKGVRGNHDQKVLEWRKWMEALGPLDQENTERVAGASEGVSSDYEGEEDEGSYVAQGRLNRVAEGVRPKWEKEQVEREKRMKNGPRPRKEKRDWMDWLSSSSMEDKEGGSTSIEKGVVETGDEEDSELSPTKGYSEEEEEEEQIASSTASTRPTDRRRPFGQRPARLSASSELNSASSTSSRIARPTAYSSKSKPTSLSSSSAKNTTLLGALYAHLDPTLSSSQRSKLGLTVPAGWEWGSEHFEIARHMTKEDIEYLEGLPLTLWVEELNSFVVHAGLVPWSETPTSSLSPLPSSLSNSPLVSTSETSFIPSSTTYRSLLSSLRGSLLLVPSNIDPFTLLNLRTLSLVHAASHSTAKVKGPANEWKVSSKSHKAGKNSQPWWNVWEGAIKEYEKENEESVGVVYGHWASQGLQVQDHSIGLDSGCVYGRQLSALVLDLSDSSPNPLSLLASSTAATSSSPSRLKANDATSSPTAESSSKLSNSRVQDLGTGGGRFDRIVKGSSSASSSQLATPTSLNSDSEPTSTGIPSKYEDDLDQESEQGRKPWWKPWKRSIEDDEDSEGDEEASYQGTGGESELRKRAPPQFRPMGGLDQEKILSAAAEADEYEEEEPTSTSSSTSSTESATSTERVQRKKPHQFGQQKVSSSTSSSLTTPARTRTATRSTASQTLSPASASTSNSTSRSKSQKSAQLVDADEGDDENELAPLTASDLVEEEQETEEEQDPESMFSAKQIPFKPLGDEKSVWIVSVDCRGEVEMDTE